ncbi:conserved hypothetical protein [Ricinus communis]|uniref:Uncharacterized protein n=1 Tax=Ricinus communis TaxID=3988 RepID=B9RKZ0_RICCO|nr:conserved hypothetical protein [Ricinus communis]
MGLLSMMLNRSITSFWDTIKADLQTFQANDSLIHMVFILWRLWKAWNNLVFNYTQDSAKVIVEVAQHDFHEFQSVRLADRKGIPYVPHPTMVADFNIDEDFIKVNFDASCRSNIHRGSVDFLARNIQGALLGSSCKLFIDPCQPFIF